MATLAHELAAYMQKWTGSSGRLILANEMRMLGVSDADLMSPEQRRDMLEILADDCLRTFLSPTRLQLARAELAGILGIPNDPPK